MKSNKPWPLETYKGHDEIMIYFSLDLGGRTIGERPAKDVVAEKIANLDPPMKFSGDTLQISCASGMLKDYLVKKYLDDLPAAGIALPDVRQMDMSVWVENYGSAEYKKQLSEAKVLDDARNNLRDVDYQEAPDMSDVDLAGDAGIEDVHERMGAVLGGVLGSQDGLCLARSHGQLDSINALEAAIDTGAADILFLEEFTTEDQGLIDAYLQGDEEDIPADLMIRIELLDSHFMGLPKWEAVLKKAKQNGVQIHAIDSGAAREVGDTFGTEAFGEQRDAMMNSVVKEVMERVLNDPLNAGKKHISVVGAAHANTHRGGVPGVSQMFGVPVFTIDDTMGAPDLVVSKEDKSLRGMPSRDEQGYIDTALAQKYRASELRGDSQKGARDDLTKQAELLKTSGALPTFEECLLREQYLKKLKTELGDQLDLSDAASLAMAELAADRKIDQDRADLLAQWDVRNKAVVVTLAGYVRTDPRPGNADALENAHTRARDLAGKGGVKELMEALSLLEYINTNATGGNQAAPVPVDMRDRTAAIDAGAAQADLLAATTLIARFDELKTAIAANDTAEVRRLIQLDPGIIKVTDAKGRNALHLAALQENAEMITAIGTDVPGINLDIPDADGNSAIHLASLARRVDRETDTDEAVDEAQKKQSDAVKALLAKGANVDMPNADGATALHLTSLNYNTELLEALFDANADVTVKDDRGWTPMDVSIGATSTVIEQTYYQRGKAVPTPMVLEGAPMSTIDILCQATLCEKPEDIARVRTAYEEAFANPEMRPVLELVALDAARPRTPPDAGTRLFVADGGTADSLIKRKDGDVQMGYRGGYDKHAGVCHVSSDTGAVDFAGVLMHELTHRAAHVACGPTVYPFDPTDEGARDRYVGAIEEDVKNMHLMSPSSPMEVEAQRCIMQRMQAYSLQPGEDGGDPALLQEFIVSIPQLMASYGPEAVNRMAPNLSYAYAAFKNTCANAAKDPKFNAVRGHVDNTVVVVTERDYEQDDASGWVQPDAGALGIDALIGTMTTEYAVRHGVVDETRLRPDALGDGAMRMNPVTIKFDTGMYKIPEDQADAVAAKMNKVMAALQKSLGADLMTLPISTGDYKQLVREVTQMAHDLPIGEIEKAVRAKTDAWLFEAKSRYLDHTYQSNSILSDIELAETIAIASETRASGAGLTTNVNPDKHKQLVAKLTERIGPLDPAQKGTLEAQNKLMDRAVVGLAGGDAPAVRIRTGRKIFGTRDPEHVSIDTGKVQRAWVQILRTLV
ncbi:ankyrin repeat domain-containing protein [Tateyamaria sp.]|jgi:hypothetical protein|uniref:ankyrin repeat domain-containing protein n=2 Tax=Tateyamaria sp. TaxID=1929288 RepID=UPI0032DE16B4